MEKTTYTTDEETYCGACQQDTRTHVRDITALKKGNYGYQDSPDIIRQCDCCCSFK